MADSDLLRRFLFERWPVRGQFVRLGAAWRAVIEHHDYPPVVMRTLGEAMAATVLVAGTLKFKGRLLLQCQGPGPMHLLLAECTDRHAIRGLARYRGQLPSDDTLAGLTGGGSLAVTIDNPQHTSRYQGIVPLDHPRLAACLEHYFGQSDQLPTTAAAGRERGAGRRAAAAACRERRFGVQGRRPASHGGGRGCLAPHRLARRDADARKSCCGSRWR